MTPDGRTTLMLSAGRGQTAALRLLLDRYPEDLEKQHAEGGTAFSLACNAGQVESMKMLKEAGCDVKVVTKDGDTGLMLAAAEGKCEALRWLLDECESDPHARGEGGATGFLLACRFGRLETMKMLRDEGCDVKLKYLDGQTPLMVTCGGREPVRFSSEDQYHSRKRHPACLRWLVDEFEWDLEARDSTHMTAFLLATATGRLECMEILMEAGCDVDPVIHANTAGWLQPAPYDRGSKHVAEVWDRRVGNTEMTTHLSQLKIRRKVGELTQLAKGLVKDERWAEAEATMAKAVRLSPDNATILAMAQDVGKRAKFHLAEADLIAKQHEAELLAALDGEAAAASEEQGSEKAKKKREKRRRQQEAKQRAAAVQAEEQAAAAQAVEASDKAAQSTSGEAGSKAASAVSQTRKKKDKRRRQLERKAQQKAAAQGEKTAAQEAQAPLTESELDAVAQLVVPPPPKKGPEDGGKAAADRLEQLLGEINELSAMVDEAAPISRENSRQGRRMKVRKRSF